MRPGAFQGPRPCRSSCTAQCESFVDRSLVLGACCEEPCKELYTTENCCRTRQIPTVYKKTLESWGIQRSLLRGPREGRILGRIILLVRTDRFNNILLPCHPAKCSHLHLRAVECGGVLYFPHLLLDRPDDRPTAHAIETSSQWTRRLVWGALWTAARSRPHSRPW